LRIAGVVSEYNPFHKGHGYHLGQTRALLGADTGLVCVMSGNFVQRGEPAAFEKHARALAAVLSGADLVLELPVPFVLRSAEGFALGAVSLLHSLGCVDFLSFGSESGDLDELKQAAALLAEPGFSEELKKALKTGMSFAAARQIAAETRIGRKLHALELPNNNLGIEYIKAIGTLGSGIVPITVKRIGAGHDQTGAGPGPLSASQLRDKLKKGLDILEDLDMAAMIVFREELTNGLAPITIDAMELPILARLRSMSACDYELLPDATEGLGLRLMHYAKTETSIRAILEKSKTKRYAMSRLRRMVLCAYLGITAQSSPKSPLYARVLACNARGREIINRIDQNMPVITKPASVKRLGDEAAALFECEVRATDLFSLAYPDPVNSSGGQEWTIGPEIV
jgi:predicted nucleotidyltransferase